MKKLMLFIGLLLMMPMVVFASGDEFCAGFEEGYRMIKGDMVLLPICPLAPLTPLGSNNFREGIKAEILAAQES